MNTDNCYINTKNKNEKLTVIMSTLQIIMILFNITSTIIVIFKSPVL